MPSPGGWVQFWQVAAVVDEPGRQRETAALELAVDDGRDPPAGDVVAAQLEEPGWHQSAPGSAAAGSHTARIASILARAAAGSPSGGGTTSRAPSASARATANAAAARATDFGRGFGRFARAPARSTSTRGRAGRRRRSARSRRAGPSRSGRCRGSSRRARCGRRWPRSCAFRRRTSSPGSPALGSAATPSARAGPDKGGLERPNQRSNEEPPIRQLHDRVCGQLAGTVVRDLAAALGLDQLDPARRQLRGARQHVRWVAVAAERQDRLVLEEESWSPISPAARAATRRCCRSQASRY